LRISRLVESQDAGLAGAQARIADAAGVAAVWLRESPGSADPRAVARAQSLRKAEYVLEFDPEVDLELPVGVAVNVALAGRGGWADSLAAIARGAEPGAEPLCWVFAKDVGTVATAGRGGVGAVLPALENADTAEEWVSEYNAELASAAARPVAGRINAACAAIVALDDDVGVTIGLIERYRQAGIDEVILRGESVDEARTLKAILDEFNDSEVSEMSDKRSKDRAPAIDAMSQRTGQPAGQAAGGAAGGAVGGAAGGAAGGAGTPPPVGSRPPSQFALWVKKKQEQIVARMSDRQLDMTVGSRVGVRALMMVMAARFRPDKAEGFVGDIEMKLNTGRGQRVWTINCRADGARARRGGSPDARLRIEATLADFLRVGTGEISAPTAVLGGKLLVLGDFALALRMGEMFDGPPIV
jgi:putative sterol carrier protein